MRSLVLFTIGGALLLIALATGCKSDDAAAKKAAASDVGATAGSAAGQPEDPVPALPIPRRMRGGDSPDEATGDTGGRSRGWRGGRREPSEEMRQRMAEMRQRFDSNSDGKIDEEERIAMREARVKERVARIDSDGDGKISRQEAEAAPGGRMLRDFDAVDANQDSVISPEELEAAMSERRSQRRERWRGRGDGESGGAPETSPTE
jgi:hypothetical protein